MTSPAQRQYRCLHHRPYPDEPVGQRSVRRCLGIACL